MFLCVLSKTLVVSLTIAPPAEHREPSTSESKKPVPYCSIKIRLPIDTSYQHRSRGERAARTKQRKRYFHPVESINSPVLSLYRTLYPNTTMTLVQGISGNAPVVVQGIIGNNAPVVVQGISGNVPVVVVRPSMDEQWTGN
jgi:hypothetical protein